MTLAGDHPDLCQRRMQWALRAVRDAYAAYPDGESRQRHSCPEASAHEWLDIADPDHVHVPDVLQSLDVNSAGNLRPEQTHDQSEFSPKLCAEAA